jgi:hypothetical protein
LIIENIFLLKLKLAKNPIVPVMIPRVTDAKSIVEKYTTDVENRLISV